MVSFDRSPFKPFSLKFSNILVQAPSCERHKTAPRTLFLLFANYKLWCGAAQFMVRRGSVGSASACCKAGPSSILGSAPQGGSHTEQTSDEDMERGLSEWRRINVLNECDCMNVRMYVIKYEK